MILKSSLRKTNYLLTWSSHITKGAVEDRKLLGFPLLFLLSFPLSHPAKVTPSKEVLVKC